MILGALRDLKENAGSYAACMVFDDYRFVDFHRDVNRDENLYSAQESFI